MTDDSPRQRLARTLGRRGLLAALITAAGVYVLLLVQGTILGLLATIGQLVAFGPSSLERGSDAYSLVRLGPDLATLWGDRVQGSLLTDLPFAVGFFLALWQVLPIAPELRFAHVVTRALFGGGLGAAAVLVVGAVQTLVLAAGMLGAGDLGRSSSEAGHAIGVGMTGGVLHAAGTWVTDVPIVVLAGLLLWGFLQRFPPKHAVAGVVDEL